MKKILKLLVLPLLVCLPMATFVSCSDDDDLPDVSMSISVDDATVVDDVIYVVKGETLDVVSVNITNNEQGKNAMVTAAAYYFDGFRIGVVIIPPYGLKIPTKDVALGKHAMQIVCDVAAEGKALGIAALDYDVVVVEDAADIPSGKVSDKVGSTVKVQ